MMFRRRNNIIKQAGKRLAPNSKQLKTIFQDLFPNPASEQKHQQPDINSDNNPELISRRKNVMRVIIEIN